MEVVIVIRGLLTAGLALAGLSCVSISATKLPNPTGLAGSVWSVDLIRTLPGMQTEYLASIENNWAGARKLARDRGAVLSYRALVADPAPERGWDVILMTEYADSAAWSRREETFREIFAAPEFVGVEPASPSSEMREFVASGVVMRGLIEGGAP
jgi:hypothetical protein